MQGREVFYANNEKTPYPCIALKGMISDLPKRQKVLWVCKQFLKKPAKKYINIQEGGQGGVKLRKPSILVVN
jgi:hypothetical protein